MSEIAPSTVRAYLETDYCVTAPEPFMLRIGVASAPLTQLYRQHRTDCSTFITACNPYSRIVGDEENAERQAGLARELNQLGLTFFDGVGRHPAGGWPEEPGYLVLGLSLAAAKALGEKHRQNAIVWCGPGAMPKYLCIYGYTTRQKPRLGNNRCRSDQQIPHRQLHDIHSGQDRKRRFRAVVR